MADQKNDRTYSVDRYNGKGQWDGWSQANPNGGVDHYNGKGQWDGWSQANPNGGVDHYDGSGYRIGSSLPNPTAGGAGAAGGSRGVSQPLHTYYVSPEEKKLNKISGRLSTLGIVLYVLGLAYTAAVMIFRQMPQGYLPAACILALTLIVTMYLLSAANCLPGFGGLFFIWLLSSLAHHVLSMFRAWNEYGLSEMQMLTLTGVGAGAAILIMLLCTAAGLIRRHKLEKRILGYVKSRR